MASNLEVIKHGENGFLASSDDEWIEYLSTLVQDEALRHRMSKRAAEEAKAKYSLEANASRIVEAFKAALR
jgi:glycosyltransferase involved in cell wall biosynthesis